MWEGQQGVNAAREEGTTRAIGLWKESVLSRDFRISFRGGLLVLFPGDPEGLPRGRAGGKEGGEGRDVEARRV